MCVAHTRGGGSGDGNGRDPTRAVPADWAAQVAAGDMLFATTVPGPGYFPYVGNGFVATEISTSTMYMGGVFNGLSNYTPSHRAAIPSTVNTVLPVDASPAGAAVFAGAALDLRRAAFYNRTQFTVGPCAGSTVQQTWCVAWHGSARTPVPRSTSRGCAACLWLCVQRCSRLMRVYVWHRDRYANRAHRDLLVYELRLLPPALGGDAAASCTVGTAQAYTPTSPDFDVVASPAVPGCGTSCLWEANTLLAELPGLRTLLHPPQPPPRCRSAPLTDQDLDTVWSRRSQAPAMWRWHSRRCRQT